MRQHFRIILIIASFVLALAALFTNLMYITFGYAMFTGFAVDAEGCVYVGREAQICVYRDDNQIRTINAQTSRGYAFTIEDDTIFLDTGSQTYRIDLQGNVVEESPTLSNSAKEKLRKVKVSGASYSYRTADGRSYSCVKTLRGYQIYDLDSKALIWSQEENEVILGYFAKGSTLGVLLCAAVLLATWRKD